MESNYGANVIARDTCFPAVLFHKVSWVWQRRSVTGEQQRICNDGPRTYNDFTSIFFHFNRKMCIIKMKIDL